MTTYELRAAAELCRGKTIANKYDNAASKVAAAWLSEHDDTPADRDWIRAVWPSAAAQFGFDYTTITIESYGPKSWTRAERDSWTRGQVRSLARVVGVTLNET